MCGINGFSWDDKAIVRKMNDTISYRGPDQAGIFTDRGISLGHRRLSIIDLSEKGRQPMTNEDGTIQLVYNGEIYNFKEIRKKLIEKGHRFASNTDSEAIVHAYEEYGTDCVQHFNGMFAFAIWDDRKKLLFLVRDRIGVKPLYYFFDGMNIIFSSEIKAIVKNHNIKRVINRNVLNQYLKYRFIVSDETFLAGVKKLLPGHFLVFRNNKISVSKYWDISWPKIENQPEEFYLKELEKLLTDSVKLRMVADVPLGAYLSGGIDSSLIVALNAKLRDDPVKTFTVGFGHETDEFRYAKMAAEHLDTEHHELVLDFNRINKALPKIIWQMDEPNTDITMVPLYFLSEFSRKKVTVVNTGEGADEIFSGYHHYKVGSSLFRAVPGAIKNHVYNWYYSPFKKDDRKNLIAFPFEEDNTLMHFLNRKEPKDTLNKILLFDIKNELPNWQLQRVDRMTMAHSQEARVPFLDYRIVEFSTTLPVSMKQPGFGGKYILKKLATKFLPKEIVYRKKQGFTTPMHAWLKHSLEEMSSSILSEDILRKNGLFNPKYVKDLIDKHKATSRQKPFQLYSYQLLILIQFQLWYDMYIEKNCELVRF